MMYHYTTLHYTIIYYNILYYTILYYTILYYTIDARSRSSSGIAAVGPALAGSSSSCVATSDSPGPAKTESIVDESCPMACPTRRFRVIGSTHTATLIGPYPATSPAWVGVPPECPLHGNSPDGASATSVANGLIGAIPTVAAPTARVQQVWPRSPAWEDDRPGRGVASSRECNKCGQSFDWSNPIV